MTERALGAIQAQREPTVLAEYPLTFGQRALWFTQQLLPQSAAHNLGYACCIRTRLDIPAFHRAVQRQVDLHPALRTSFAASGGEPFQRVYRTREVLFQSEDASAWSDQSLDQRLEQLVGKEELEQLIKEEHRAGITAHFGAKRQEALSATDLQEAQSALEALRRKEGEREQ